MDQWAYPDELDAVAAAPNHHIVLFEATARSQSGIAMRQNSGSNGNVDASNDASRSSRSSTSFEQAETALRRAPFERSQAHTAIASAEQRVDIPVLRAEGHVTFIDGMLVVAVLVGLTLSAVAGGWWADPLAGFVIVFYGLKDRDG